MDLRQLAALAAIADHGSFSGAAKALYTVQSNVSAHIQRLETELGVVLVDRGRGRLTHEGALVVERARRMQSEIDAIHADLAALHTDVSGEVRLGVIGTTARWLMPQFLIALRDQHPKVRVIIVEGNSTSLLPQLVGGRLDAAVINLPVDDPDVAVEPLFDEEMVLVTTPDHPLANESEVDLRTLADHELLLGPKGTPLRDDLDEAARLAGVTLHSLAEIDGVRLMASLAFEGFGPALVPSTAIPGWLRGSFVRIRVSDLPRRQVGLAQRRRTSLSAPARATANVLTDVLARNGAQQLGVRVHGTSTL